MALSSISSEEIWSKSGRLESAGSEVFPVSRASHVDSDSNIALSVQGQEGCEISTLPNPRGRDHLLGFEYSEII